MAKKTKVTGATFNLNQKRVDEIASALRVNAADINVDVSLHNDAKDAAKAAGEVVNSKRVDIMFVVADLAEKNNWHPEEVKSASRMSSRVTADQKQKARLRLSCMKFATPHIQPCGITFARWSTW